MRNFYLSIIIIFALIIGIFSYQRIIEKKCENIINNTENPANIEIVSDEWEEIKPMLYAFNDHLEVLETDIEFKTMKNFLKLKINEEYEVHKTNFLERLEKLKDASKPYVINIL